MTATVTVNCNVCHQPFERPVQRGRPATRCPECRATALAAIADKSIVKDVPSSVLASVPPAQLKVLLGEDYEEVNGGPEPMRQVWRPSTVVDNTPYRFRLMVSNLGIAYGGEVEAEALVSFNSYARRSADGFGQIGFARVQLWKLDAVRGYELVKDFDPNIGRT